MCGFRFTVCIKGIIDNGGEFFVNEILDLVAPIVNDAVDAEVEVCVIGTEELLKEYLKFLLRSLHVFCHFFTQRWKL